MIEVKNVSKKYRNKLILDDISFSVEKGQYVAVIGTNGCGKSTLLKIMTGSIKANGGEILFEGHSLKKEERIVQNMCGYVPQGNPLMEELSVYDNLLLWKNKKEDMEQIIEEFGLSEMLKTRVNKLSGGMKRRLSIALALMNRPKILFLDEPTAALDIHYQTIIHNILEKYNQNGGTVVMVTHDAEEIMRANRKLFIQNGNLTELSSDITMENITKLINGGNEKNGKN